MKLNLLYKKGTVLYWKHTGKPAYVKEGETEWDWWYSMERSTDKPLKERPGFRRPDVDVRESCEKLHAVYTIKDPDFMLTERVGGLVRVWLHNGNHFYVRAEHALRFNANL